MPTSDQSYSNHTRWDPLFHFFVLPGVLILLVIAIIMVIHEGAITHNNMWRLLASIVLVVLALKTRTYALKAQDRVIRLEERLRLQRLLPDTQQGDIGKLREGQLIALRFASDAELPALATKAVSQNLSPGDIKKAITSWRPDTFRI